MSALALLGDFSAAAFPTSAAAVGYVKLKRKSMVERHRREIDAWERGRQEGHEQAAREIQAPPSVIPWHDRPTRVHDTFWMDVVGIPLDVWVSTAEKCHGPSGFTFAPGVVHDLERRRAAGEFIEKIRLKPPARPVKHLAVLDADGLRLRHGVAWSVHRSDCVCPKCRAMLEDEQKRLLDAGMAHHDAEIARAMQVPPHSMHKGPPTFKPYRPVQDAHEKAPLRVAQKCYSCGSSGHVKLSIQDPDTHRDLGEVDTCLPCHLRVCRHGSTDTITDYSTGKVIAFHHTCRA